MPDRLMCVHRGQRTLTDDDPHLYWTTYDPQTNTWSSDTRFSQDNQSTSAPALLIFNGTLFCVHRGRDGDDSLYWTTFDFTTQTWAEDIRFQAGNRSSDAPALAEFEGKLYCVHRGILDDPSLYWTTFDPIAGQWAPDTRFPRGNLANAGPALANYGGMLFCLHRGHGDTNLWWTVFDRGGNTWTADKMLSSDIHTSCGPTLIIHDLTLYCAYQNGPPQDGESNLSWMIKTGGNWPNPRPFGQRNQSADTPALASFNGTLWSVYRGGKDQTLRWATSRGSSFGGDTLFPHDNRSFVGPALIGVSFP